MAPHEPRVSGILALGPPVMLDWADFDPRQFMTVGQFTSLRGGIRKALDLYAWRRVLRFKTDFRPMVKSFGTLWARRKPAPASALATGRARRDSANMNPYFAPASSGRWKRGGRCSCFQRSGST